MPSFKYQRVLHSNHTFRPKVHKEENDPGSHSLSIGSQAEKEGKVEKVELSGIGELGGEKELKIGPTKSSPT